MAEREVLNFLKERPNSMFTSKELASKLNTNINSIHRNLASLSKFKVIDVVHKKQPRPSVFGIKEK